MCRPTEVSRSVVWWRLWRACQVIYQQPTYMYTTLQDPSLDETVVDEYKMCFPFLLVCVRFIRVFSLSPSPSIFQHFKVHRKKNARGDMWCSGDLMDRLISR